MEYKGRLNVSQVQLRALKRSDILALYGRSFSESIRGIAAEKEGRVLGIGGVINTAPLQAFSRITDELRKYPKMMVKMGRSLANIMNDYEQPIFAVADAEEKNAGGFLAHIGFEYVESTNVGEVYKWPTQ